MLPVGAEGARAEVNRGRPSAFLSDGSPRTNRRAAAVVGRHLSNSRSRLLRRECPSLISRSWSTRFCFRGRDRRGRRCCVRPPWFLGLWRISRPLPDAGYAFPTACPLGLTERARHGLAPKRKGQLGHLTAVHLRTSSLEPPQQSRQCARIAAAGAIGICPSSRSSSGPIFRGSRPIASPSDPASVPSAT